MRGGGKARRSDNERLEFLGDRVLGLAIAEVLGEAHPAASEGDLARGYNRLVRGQTCARVARDIGLGAYLILSESEAESGGRNKETILADAIEALLGAIFLEAGFDKARGVVRHLWQSHLAVVPQSAADAKSALQEWAQGQGLALPEYVEIARPGPITRRSSPPRCASAGMRPARGEGPPSAPRSEAAASAARARGRARGARRWLMTRARTPPSAGAVTEQRRCGFVAILGAPNSGKSTLLNALVGAKVSIVSHKVQTTRMPVRGIAIEGDSQLIFIDTPGIFRPRRRLDRAMVEAAWGGAADADVVALLVDAARGLDEDAGDPGAAEARLDEAHRHPEQGRSHPGPLPRAAARARGRARLRRCRSSGSS